MKCSEHLGILKNRKFSLESYEVCGRERVRERERIHVGLENLFLEKSFPLLIQVQSDTLNQLVFMFEAFLFDE